MILVDRSFWHKINAPTWWLILVIKLVPVSLFQATVNLFHFLMIASAKDEFQLCRYILDYKTIQFISLGVVKAGLGYFFYWQCAISVHPHDATERAACTARGPGQTIQEKYPPPFDKASTAFGGFCLQWMLIFLAFVMLPCRCVKVKGMPKYRYLNEKDQAKLRLKRKKHKCCCGIFSW